MKNNKLNSYEVEETRYRINKLIEYKWKDWLLV